MSTQQLAQGLADSRGEVDACGVKGTCPHKHLPETRIPGEKPRQSSLNFSAANFLLPVKFQASDQVYPVLTVVKKTTSQV